MGLDSLKKFAITIFGYPVQETIKDYHNIQINHKVKRSYFRLTVTSLFATAGALLPIEVPVFNSYLASILKSLLAGQKLIPIPMEAMVILISVLGFAAVGSRLSKFIFQQWTAWHNNGDTNSDHILGEVELQKMIDYAIEDHELENGPSNREALEKKIKEDFQYMVDNIRRCKLAGTDDASNKDEDPALSEEETEYHQVSLRGLYKYIFRKYRLGDPTPFEEHVEKMKKEKAEKSQNFQKLHDLGQIIQHFGSSDTAKSDSAKSDIGKEVAIPILEKKERQESKSVVSEATSALKCQLNRLMRSKGMITSTLSTAQSVAKEAEKTPLLKKPVSGLEELCSNLQKQATKEEAHLKSLPKQAVPPKAASKKR